MIDYGKPLRLLSSAPGRPAVAGSEDFRYDPSCSSTKE